MYASIKDRIRSEQWQELIIKKAKVRGQMDFGGGLQCHKGSRREKRGRDFDPKLAVIVLESLLEQ